MDKHQQRKLLTNFFGHDKYLRINYELIEQYGLMTAAILSELWWLSEYFEERKQLDENGFFTRSRVQLEKRLGMSEHLQRKHIVPLIEEGLVDFKSVPNSTGGKKNMYKVEVEKLFKKFISS